MDSVSACNISGIVCCPLQSARAFTFISQFLWLLGIYCLCISCIEIQLINNSTVLLHAYVPASGTFVGRSEADRQDS